MEEKGKVYFLIQIECRPFLSEQREDMVHNLITDLRSRGIIRNTGSRRFPRWVMVGLTHDNKQ
jgi:hypothetical protein